MISCGDFELIYGTNKYSLVNSRQNPSSCDITLIHYSALSTVMCSDFAIFCFCLLLLLLVCIWQNVRQGDTPMRPEGIFYLSPFALPPPTHYTYVAMNTTLHSSSINREMIHIPRGRLPSQSIWPPANINYRQINSGCLGIGALSCFFLSVLHFFLPSCSFSQGLIVLGCN